MAKLIALRDLPIVRLRDYAHQLAIPFHRWMENHTEIIAMIHDPLLGGRVLHDPDRADDGPRIIRLYCDHRDTAFAIKMRWG